MNCFRFPGVLTLLACLLAISCNRTEPEPKAEFPSDSATARIKTELRLMNLSEDAKTHTLSFGESNAFTERKEVPTQAVQIHEKNFYICPALRNPRFLLVGKMRVEVSTMTDHESSESSPRFSNDMTHHPDK